MKTEIIGLCGEMMKIHSIMKLGTIKCSETEFTGMIRLPEILCMQICMGCKKAPKELQKPKGLKAKGVIDRR